jgi:hypothetical protein
MLFTAANKIYIVLADIFFSAEQFTATIIYHGKDVYVPYIVAVDVFQLLITPKVLL